MLIVSVGTSHRSCRGFGTEHRRFLWYLRQATLVRRPLQETVAWKVMLGRFNAMKDRFNRVRADCYEQALSDIENRFGAQSLATSLAHRDFVPWNMHYDRIGRLFVFDWELAQDQSIQGWDMFHYHLAQRAMRHGRFGKAFFERLKSSEEADEIADFEGHMLFYLVDIALFLRDRLARAPAVKENKYLRLVEHEIWVRCANLDTRRKTWLNRLLQPKPCEAGEGQLLGAIAEREASRDVPG